MRLLMPRFVLVFGWAVMVPPVVGQHESTVPPLSLEEAVTRTLTSSPGVGVQREQMQQAEFAEEVASGAFDVALFSAAWVQRSTYAQSSPVNSFAGLVNELREDETGLTVGAVQQFRNGITVTPSATVVRTETNTNPLVPDSRSDVRLQISVPLLRGWGESAAAVNELAAQSTRVAVRQLARHNVAERVARTVGYYWQTMAAKQNLVVLQEAEARALELSERLRDMVRVGEVEAAIMEEARADLLRRRGNVVTATLVLVSNWQRLAAAMGLKPEEMGHAPKLSGVFPQVPAALNWGDPVGYQFVGLALQQRGDYQAVREDETTRAIYLRKAKNDTKPALDLDVRAGYTGFTDQRSDSAIFESLGKGTAGPVGEVMLSFEWPLANRSARGEWNRQKSLQRESALASEELATGITAETRIAVATLKAAVAQHQVAQETADAFATVVTNIRRKVNTGEASITELAQNEDRFVQARQALISAARNYAEALVEIRRVTGTLVREGPGEFDLPLTTLIQLPQPDSLPIDSQP